MMLYNYFLKTNTVVKNGIGAIRFALAPLLFLLLLFPVTLSAQVKPETPLFSATTNIEKGAYLTMQMQSSDYFWIDWGDGFAIRYDAGSYGEYNPIYHVIGGSQIKIYGDEISHIIAPNGGWTQATVGLSTGLININLSDSPLTQLDLSECVLLNSLYVSNCQLTALELGKKNKLTILSAAGNAIEQIDLSRCPILEQVDLSDNALTGSITVPSKVFVIDLSDNSLTQTDLSQATALEDLTVRNNQLTRVTLPASRSLRSVDLYGNKLTWLSCTNKTYENLVALNLAHNELVDIDLSPFPEIRGLTLSYNQLTDIDLAPCPEISSLSIHHNALQELLLEGLPRLACLDAMNNQLTTLDLSHNPEIEELWLTHNYLSSLQLPANPDWLLCVMLACNNLSTESIEAIVKALPNVSDISVPSWQEDYLKHMHCQLNPGNAEQLFSSLQQKGWQSDITSQPENYLTFSTSLTPGETATLNYQAQEGATVTLYGQTKAILNNASDSIISVVQEGERYYLAGNLTSVDLHAFQLSTIYLSASNTLTSIDLSGGKLTHLKLSPMPELKELFCQRNTLGEEAMTALIESLPDRSGLAEQGKLCVIQQNDPAEANVCTSSHIELALQRGWALYAHDGDKLVPYEAPAESRITLKTSAQIGSCIPLSIESMGDVEISGAKLLYGGLCEVEASTIVIQGVITGLDATGCQLSSLDLSDASSLQRLWCSENQLTKLDLSVPTGLQILYCTQNQLSTLDLSAIPHLKELDCSQNNLTTLNLSTQQALEFFLCYHNKLEQIDLSTATHLVGVDLSENRLTQLDLSHQPLLETLYCNGNRIDGSAMGQLISSLPDRSQMEKRGHLFGIDTKNPNEQNVIYTYDVERATSKGWTTLDYVAGDNDGNGVPYAGTTAVTSVEAKSIRVYPNPAREWVMLEGAQPKDIVKLYSVDGQCLYTTMTDGAGRVQIEISAFPIGYYLLQVASEQIWINVQH